MHGGGNKAKQGREVDCGQWKPKATVQVADVTLKASVCDWLGYAAHLYMLSSLLEFSCPMSSN